MLSGLSVSKEQLHNLNQSLIFGCICNVVLCPCVSTAERQKNDDDKKKNNSAQQREGSRGGGGAAAAVANGHGTEKREKPRSLLRGTHCSAAREDEEEKTQCNILFGINSLSLLQDHLI